MKYISFPVLNEPLLTFAVFSFVAQCAVALERESLWFTVTSILAWAGNTQVFFWKHLHVKRHSFIWEPLSVYFAITVVLLCCSTVFAKRKFFFNCTFYLRYRALPFLTKHYFDAIEVLDVNRIHHFSLLISIGYKRLLVTLNFNKKSSTEVFGKERNINMYLGIDKNGWFCSPYVLTMTTFSFPAPHTKTLECVVIHSKTRSIVQTWIGHTHILNFFFKKIKKPTIKWCKFIS